MARNLFPVTCKTKPSPPYAVFSCYNKRFIPFCQIFMYCQHNYINRDNWHNEGANINLSLICIYIRTHKQIPVKSSRYKNQIPVHSIKCSWFATLHPVPHILSLYCQLQITASVNLKKMRNGWLMGEVETISNWTSNNRNHFVWSGEKTENPGLIWSHNKLHLARMGWNEKRSGRGNGGTVGQAESSRVVKVGAVLEHSKMRDYTGEAAITLPHLATSQRRVGSFSAHLHICIQTQMQLQICDSHIDVLPCCRCHIKRSLQYIKHIQSTKAINTNFQAIGS